MNETPIILTDLDDTLFQTARKIPADQSDGIKPMSTLQDGDPSGYATRRQRALLYWCNHGQVIPVTARSREVLARVDITQAPAICSNGGCIVKPDGDIDMGWHLHLMQNDVSAVAQIHNQMIELATKAEIHDLRHWVVKENDLDLYIVFKSNTDDMSGLTTLANLTSREVLPEGWRVHQNGNNLAISPPWISKRAATKYLIDSLRDKRPNAPIIGIGDSTSDAGFMDLCDFAMMPVNSQLWGLSTRDNDWVE